MTLLIKEIISIILTCLSCVGSGLVHVLLPSLLLLLFTPLWAIWISGAYQLCQVNDLLTQNDFGATLRVVNIFK